MKRKSKVHEAIDQLSRRPDARMVLTNYHRGPDYWIVPQGIRIEPEVARKVIAHPQVVGGKDSLFPNLDQTWRIRREAAD